MTGKGMLRMQMVFTLSAPIIKLDPTTIPDLFNYVTISIGGDYGTENPVYN